MAESLVNRAPVNLNATITNVATTITRASAATGWPGDSGGPPSTNYRLVLTDGTNYEVVLVTGGQGTTSLTVTRAVEAIGGATTAFAFSSPGTTMTPVATAAGIGAMYQAIPATKITTFQGVQLPSSTATITQYHFYLSAVQIPYSCTITGVAVSNGSTAAGNMMVAMYDSSGAQVGASNSTAMSGTFTPQQVPFTSTYSATAGMYFIGAASNSTTAQFGRALTFGYAAEITQASLIVPASVTPLVVGNLAWVISVSTY